ncbi:hypothetical protein CU011_0194 [Enterococcus faecium]|nr:hypothetical protein D357_00729 [Enterococcus faecium SD3B-2]MBK4781005.1 hypothetical protein [Enterococcus faecium]MBK4808477.1 hypothetical protein [Enterococcus faecium]MBK4860368.1 hypothetical protein [Enterococcus faecium]MBK4869068.1 hypothetical protein [Enterococcus faecium]
MTAKDEYFLETSCSKRNIVCLLDVFCAYFDYTVSFFYCQMRKYVP